MRPIRITATYYLVLVAATSIVQSTPIDLDPVDTFHIAPFLPGAAKDIVGWYKRALDDVFGFVLNWIPGAAPVSHQVTENDNHLSVNNQRVDKMPSKACIDPTVRTEWRSLSVEQKKAWIDAVRCLAKHPSSGKLKPTVNPVDPINVNPPVNHSGSWYDDLTYAHMDLNTHVHQTGLFFPWHRYFLWSFETTLKEQCGYSGTLPYWNWTLDVPDFQNSSIMHDSDPKSGLGGFGDHNHGEAVRDGAFAGLQLAYPSPHTLRREYTPYPYADANPLWFPNRSLAAESTFTPEVIKNVSSSFRGDFQAFQTYLERMQGPHMSIHLILGGDLGGSCPDDAPRECIDDAKWSPNEPMFWLHHAMLDKLWSDWQRAHPTNFRAFKAGTIRDLDGWPKYPTGAPPAMTPEFRLPSNGILVGNYTVGDMFNTTSNAPLCYTYA